MTASCHPVPPADGNKVEAQVLLDNNLRQDFTDPEFLRGIAAEVNCADSTVLGKKIVLADEFHSADTSQILLIPYKPNGNNYSSSAYSDVRNRIILINPSYIQQFSMTNTLSDTASYGPVVELMLLHEIGHFILRKTGAFDNISGTAVGAIGQSTDNTQPEYLTSVKKVELDADSLAIDLVKKSLLPNHYSCLNIAFDIERIVPGMQFELSGRRMIDNFGATDIGFLHDPSNDHPNLELRITFMNYFLYPSDSLRQMIDNYIYDRTVAPVHRQESDPRIFQGQEKKPN